VTRGLLSLGPFGHKIHQGMGFDCCLGHVGYVEPHELECLLGDPSRGEDLADIIDRHLYLVDVHGFLLLHHQDSVGNLGGCHDIQE
jgi:hypothetical protein